MMVGMRVLVADDDKVSTLILAAALRSWSFEVSVAHDGAEAWTRLVEERPAMAILDWMMPEVDGPTLCRRLRERPELAGTYVMLLTSRDARADLVAGLDAGADDYVTKPVDREELRARVAVGARVAALQARLSERVVELQNALAQVKQLEGCCGSAVTARASTRTGIPGCSWSGTSVTTQTLSSVTASVPTVLTRSNRILKGGNRGAPHPPHTGRRATD
jgi:DNA-binding response OmpR family regulator